MLLNNLNVIRNCVLLANFNSKKKIYLILGYLNIYMLKCQVHCSTFGFTKHFGASKKNFSFHRVQNTTNHKTNWERTI